MSMATCGATVCKITPSILKVRCGALRAALEERDWGMAPEAVLLIRQPEDYYDEGEVVVDPFRLDRIEVAVRLGAPTYRPAKQMGARAMRLRDARRKSPRPDH
jgi:hypothetical protein